jgi:hypothetical protein
MYFLPCFKKLSFVILSRAKNLRANDRARTFDADPSVLRTSPLEKGDILKLQF